MDVSTFVKTTFDEGETRRRNIGRLRRAPDEFGSEPDFVHFLALRSEAELLAKPRDVDFGIPNCFAKKTKPKPGRSGRKKK